MKYLSDEDLMKMAYRMATWSQDLRTQNGAILVDPSKATPVAFGCNNIPHPGSVTKKRLEKPLKNAWTEHAERAAIFHAAATGVCTDGLWMYCCWAACGDCARAIISAGITKLFRHKAPHHRWREDWAETISIGDEMLEEAGVDIVEMELFAECSIRFDGKVIDV